MTLIRARIKPRHLLIVFLAISIAVSASLLIAAGGKQTPPPPVAPQAAGRITSQALPAPSPMQLTDPLPPPARRP
jgi:hypothetical protein